MKLYSMMFYCVVVVICSGCAGMPSYYDSPVHPSRKAMRALVDAPVARVTFLDGNGGGSAIYIGNHEFLTALHVLLDDDNNIIQHVRIEGYFVSIVLLDSGDLSEDGILYDDQDWARFRVSDCEIIKFLQLRLQLCPIDMEPTSIKKGDVIFFIGYPIMNCIVQSKDDYERIPLSIIDGRVVSSPFIWINTPDDLIFVRRNHVALIPHWMFVGMSGGLVVKLDSKGFHFVGIAHGTKSGLMVAKSLKL